MYFIWKSFQKGLDKEQNINKVYSLLVRLVIVMILCCNAGYVLWFAARQVCHNYVRQDNGVIRDSIIISKADFENRSIVKWIEKDEISYEGKMFDIKYQHDEDGIIVLYGTYDSIDSAWIDWLSKLTDDGSDESVKWDQIFTSVFDTLAPEVHLTQHISPYTIAVQNPAIVSFLPSQFTAFLFRPPCAPSLEI